MTRHVDACNVYVETSRIRDRLLARKAARGIAVDGKGRLEAPDSSDVATDAPQAVTIEEIKAAVLKEVATSESKRNCADFVDDIGEWLSQGEAFRTVNARVEGIASDTSVRPREATVPKSFDDVTVGATKRRSRRLSVGLN